MAKIADQALQRRYQLYRDQHNREWGGNVEIATGHPCGGPLSPRFQAPLRVPPHYITIDDRRAGRCLIDYPTWVHDLKQASTNYLNKGRRYGYEKYGALFDASRPFTEEVLLFLGPAPRPVEPVLAAKAGNRWVLGLLLPDGTAPSMPEKLAAFFVSPQAAADAERAEWEEEGVPAVPDELYDPPAATVKTVRYETAPAKARKGRMAVSTEMEEERHGR